MKATIAYVRKDKTVITSICKEDGGYETVGLNLIENYNNPKQACFAASTWEDGDINNAFEFADIDSYIVWSESLGVDIVYVYSDEEWFSQELKKEGSLSPLMNKILLDSKYTSSEEGSWQEKGEIQVGELIKYLLDKPQTMYVVFDNLRFEKRKL